MSSPNNLSFIVSLAYTLSIKWKQIYRHLIFHYFQTILPGHWFCLHSNKCYPQGKSLKKKETRSLETQTYVSVICIRCYRYSPFISLKINSDILKDLPVNYRWSFTSTLVLKCRQTKPLCNLKARQRFQARN